MTAFELCGQYNDEQFMVKNGRVVWESISYRPDIDKCFISRMTTDGGKPFLLGLTYRSRYIDPDTKIKIVNTINLKNENRFDNNE